MLVYTKCSDDPNVEVIGTRFVRGLKFMQERAEIAMFNGFSYKKLFKVSTASVGTRVYSHSWVKEADVVVLGWFNQGLLSLRGIRRLQAMGKPLVWVMHDMWAMTGICHHAFECIRFKEGGCGKCPFLTGYRTSDLSRRVWQKKMDLVARVPIRYVAVSHWLANQARESLLLRDADIDVIPNAFPADFFSLDGLYDSELDPLASSGANELRVVICAARLDDPIKGLPYAIDALNYIFDNHPDIARRMTAIFVGGLRDPSAFDNLRLHHIHLGRVNDHAMLRQIYAYSQVVLSTSLYESLPGTLIEGQSMGCIPVTFDRGGQCDIVTHRQTGFIAEYQNPESVAEGIIWGATEAMISREELHQSVVERFSAGAIARRYIDLFSELTAAKEAKS